MSEIISSKNLCIVIPEILRLIDRRFHHHGERVAFLLSCMLKCQGEFEGFEIAEYTFLGLLHDIGAFKVEQGTDMLKFEIQTPMPHSIYGYLLMKYLSPMDERARILMYTHIDYNQMKNMNFPEKDIANYLNLAGRVDLYNNSLGKKFDYRKFRVYEETKYSKKALDLFDLAVKKYDVFDVIAEKRYKEINMQTLDDIMFSDEERQKYTELLMYVSGFRDEYNVINTITSMCVAEEIASLIGGFSEDDMEKLHFGAMLHDIGMFSVPLSIINAPRALTDEEMVKMRRHVDIMETLLEGRVDPDILAIAIAHHERLDGSGYPRGLTNADMNILQKILQVADTVTGLTCKRTFRKPKPKEAVIAILMDDMNHNKYDRKVVKTFTEHYDHVMNVVEKRSEEILTMFRKLNRQYEQISTVLLKKRA